MKTKIIHVPHVNVPDVLPLVFDYLQGIAQHEAQMPFDELLDEIVNDRMQMHLMWDLETSTARGVLLTAIEIDGFGRRVCHLQNTRGTGGPEWFDDYKTLEDWAREYAKCSLMRFTGRPGWKKFLEREGFALKKFVFDKPLEA